MSYYNSVFVYIYTFTLYTSQRRLASRGAEAPSAPLLSSSVYNIQHAIYFLCVNIYFSIIGDHPSVRPLFTTYGGKSKNGGLSKCPTTALRSFNSEDSKYFLGQMAHIANLANDGSTLALNPEGGILEHL